MYILQCSVYDAASFVGIEPKYSKNDQVCTRLRLNL